MRALISVITMLALLLALTAPAAASGAGEPQHPRGKVIGDLHSGRLSFEASNGFTITGQIRSTRLHVTITDDLGDESVVFEVEPPRQKSRSAEFRMAVGGATFVHRSGVEGEPGEVQITLPDGRSARHLDLHGQSPAARVVPEQADLAVYELLREVALDQASFSFWEGVDQLADELAATSPTEPTTCFFVCLGCISAILAYLASVGGLVVGCATLTPVCILAILGHQAGHLALIAACGACAICLDDWEARVRRYGSGGPIPNIQQ